jgi:hypothetical protein
MDQGGGNREQDQIQYKPEGEIPLSQKDRQQNVNGCQFKGFSPDEKIGNERIGTNDIKKHPDGVPQ